jgi:hypothetical protein
MIWLIGLCFCISITYIVLVSFLLYAYVTTKRLRNAQTQTDDTNNIPLFVIHPNADVELLS